MNEEFNTKTAYANKGKKYLSSHFRKLFVS